ncbi:hypothetical protein HYW20_03190 [Candidatus Woesearchaeota archaeon]|nr:hypothetical protein [Candidatus Woesearchaeota archaeon]
MEEVLIEPDVVINEIGVLSRREGIVVDEDDLEARIGEVESLLAEQERLSNPNVLYEERRQHYIKTQKTLLGMAQIGGENEALQLAKRFTEMYLSLIPSQKRREEYLLRIAQSKKS